MTQKPVADAPAEQRASDMEEKKAFFTPNAWQWTSMALLSTGICAVAILLGTHKIPLGNAAIVLMPVLWAVLMGAIIGVQKIKPMSGQSRAVSSVLLDVSIVLFLAALGVSVGPALSELTDIGPAIVLQEVGHILGTVILALPVGVALGMGKMAIGATWAIDRESYLAYALQRFGVKSPIYRGVFSVWLLGSVFGAVFISILAGLLGGLGIFDARALALGLGLGSGSMMLGGVAALSVIYPEQAGEIMALAALANLVTNLVGFYAGVFLSLPMSQRLYKFWSRIFRRNDDGERVALDGTVKVKKSAKKHISAMNTDGVTVDPVVRMKPSTWLLAFGISLLAGFLLNALGTKQAGSNEFFGVLLLGVLTAAAFLIAKFVSRVPASVWVLALGTLVAAPFMPTAGLVTSLTEHVDALFVGLGSIALLGLNLGRDVNALKSLNWKIVIVGMMTFTASFVAAVVLAQFVIHV